MNFLLRFKKEENGFGETFLNKEELSSLLKKHNIPFTLKKVGGTPIFYLLIKHEDVPFGNSSNDIKKGSSLQNGNSRIYIFEDYWITTFSGIVYQGRFKGSSHETEITVQPFKNSHIDIDSIRKNSSIKELTKYIKTLYNIIDSKRYEYIEDIEPEDLIRFFISLDKKDCAIIFYKNFEKYSELNMKNILTTESSTFDELFRKKYKSIVENFTPPKSYDDFIKEKIGYLLTSQYGVSFTHKDKMIPSNMGFGRELIFSGKILDIEKKFKEYTLSQYKGKEVFQSFSTDKIFFTFYGINNYQKKIKNLNNLLSNVSFLMDKNRDKTLILIEDEIATLKLQMKKESEPYIQLIKEVLVEFKYDITDNGFVIY